NFTEYRTKAFWRGGDNPSGLYILYDFNDEKWRFSDVTNRSIVNLDLIDFIMEIGNKSFRQAIDLIIFCSGKDNGYAIGNNLQIKKPRKSVMSEPIDNSILETFNYGLHPILSNQGFTPETAQRFKVGWCSHGELKDRIIFPIINEMNMLCSVQGRAMDDRIFPKYCFLKN